MLRPASAPQATGRRPPAAAAVVKRLPACPGVRALGLGPPARQGIRVDGTSPRQQPGLVSVQEAVRPMESTDPAPFFEPLLRGFLLGVGAGALFETAHVLSEFGGLAASEAGPAAIAEALAGASEVLEPLFLWDHVTAVTCWALFYTLETVSMLAVLDDKRDGDASASAFKQRELTVAVAKILNSLPRTLMPVPLHAMKTFIFQRLNGGSALLADPATASAFAPDATTMAFRDNQAPDVPMPRPGVRGAGASVLDRPAPPAEQQRKKKLQAAPEPQPKANKPVTPKLRPSKDRGLKAGAWDPKAGLPSMPNRTEELNGRKSYLRNFWYAAAISQNLGPKEPLRVDMLGRSIVLYRELLPSPSSDSMDQHHHHQAPAGPVSAMRGRVRCLDNICPHRGAPLSEGWTKEVKGHGTCVVCPYHGWAFDTEGKLAEAPSSGKDTSRLPKRPLVDAYPVEERGGFVWLFFGDSDLPADQRPPIPVCDELDDPSWRAVYGEIDFKTNHYSVFENAIDMAHIHYLHNDTFGNQDQPLIEGMQVITADDDMSVTANFNIHNKPVSQLWEWTAVDVVPVVARAHLASTSYVKIELGAGVSMITFVNTVPIDEHRSVNRFCLIRNFAGWEGFDLWARNAMFRILGEDKVMLEKLEPEKLRHEVSLAADLPQVAFRKMRQRWLDAGHGVTPLRTGGCGGSLNTARTRPTSEGDTAVTDM